MALFKFRKGGDEPVSTPSQPESVEAVRKRARHRLIGATVLVLLGVIGFPLLFDTQPRPVAVDIPIEIPSRTKARPLAVTPAAPQPDPAASAGGTAPAPVAAPSAAAPASPPAAVTAATGPSVSGAVTPAPTPPPAKPAAAAPAPKPEPKAKPVETKPAEAKAPEAKPTPARGADDGQRAQALLEGKAAEAKAAPASAAADGRYVVQVGAFADPAKARETRLKVERAGLKTYTHVAETKDGKRIRVRVGPFGTKAEADKAADKIKGLDLPAAILTL